MTTHKSSSSGVVVIGIGIGKEIFHLLGFDAAGSVVGRRNVKDAFRDMQTSLYSD